MLQLNFIFSDEKLYPGRDNGIIIFDSHWKKENLGKYINARE